MPSAQVAWPDLQKKIDDLERRGSVIVQVIEAPQGVLVIWRTPSQMKKYETR